MVLVDVVTVVVVNVMVGVPQETELILPVWTSTITRSGKKGAVQVQSTPKPLQ